MAVPAVISQTAFLIMPKNYADDHSSIELQKYTNGEVKTHKRQNGHPKIG